MTGEESIETQLAVIRTKVDQLLEMSRTRGEDHELRIRALEVGGAGQEHEDRIRILEGKGADYVTRKATIGLVLLACTLATVAVNFVALWVK